MPRPCSVCVHADRADIDARLLDGATYRTVADDTGLSETALKRHRKDHIPEALARARDAETVAEAGTLLAQVEALRDRSLALLDRAEDAGDLRTALAAIREARSTIELLLEVEGELDRRNVVNVTLSSEWIKVRAVLLDSLGAYPEAREAVSGALVSIDGGRRAS